MKIPEESGKIPWTLPDSQHGMIAPRSLKGVVNFWNRLIPTILLWPLVSLIINLVSPNLKIQNLAILFRFQNALVCFAPNLTTQLVVVLGSKIWMLVKGMKMQNV